MMSTAHIDKFVSVPMNCYLFLCFAKFSVALLMICKNSLHIIESSTQQNAAPEEISLFQVKVSNLSLLVLEFWVLL